MVLFGGGFAVLALAVWLFCVIDVITTPDGSTRTLPKLAWIFIVILLLDLGAIAWLVAGRPWQRERVPAGARTRPMSPDDDEEFLASLRERAEEQRRRAREADDDDEPRST